MLIQNSNEYWGLVTGDWGLGTGKVGEEKLHFALPTSYSAPAKRRATANSTHHSALNLRQPF
ncbi:hypothetical protein ACQFX9_22010 [Aliinostoc sp. HNIBRCY26]|uniref:hypothetical protein n=1 Tax=Aliinostoc sp. HNIBRCY26 TaxID=3418997 RepID=UPI003D03A71F